MKVFVTADVNVVGVVGFVSMGVSQRVKVVVNEGGYFKLLFSA